LEIVRVIVAVGLLAAALGAAAEILLPAYGRFIAIAAAISGIMALIVPPFLVALYGNKRPKTPLGGVNYLIRILIIAGSLSAVGVSLAVVTLVFGSGGSPARIALAAIAVLWLSVAILVAVINRRARRFENRRA
jgi:hypothetical protein